jgi:hypothetical protein
LVIWLIFFLFLQTKPSFSCLFAWSLREVGTGNRKGGGRKAARNGWIEGEVATSPSVHASGKGRSGRKKWRGGGMNKKLTTRKEQGKRMARKEAVEIIIGMGRQGRRESGASRR